MRYFKPGNSINLTKKIMTEGSATKESHLEAEPVTISSIQAANEVEEDLLNKNLARPERGHLENQALLNLPQRLLEGGASRVLLLETCRFLKEAIEEPLTTIINITYAGKGVLRSNLATKMKRLGDQICRSLRRYYPV